MNRAARDFFVKKYRLQGTNGTEKAFGSFFNIYVGFYDLANKLSTRIESNTNRELSLPDESVDFAAEDSIDVGIHKIILAPTQIGERRFT